TAVAVIQCNKTGSARATRSAAQGPAAGARGPPPAHGPRPPPAAPWPPTAGPLQPSRALASSSCTERTPSCPAPAPRLRPSSAPSARLAANVARLLQVPPEPLLEPAGPPTLPTPAAAP